MDVLFLIVGCIVILVTIVGVVSPQAFTDKKTGEIPKRLPLVLGGLIVSSISFVIAISLSPDVSSKNTALDSPAQEAVSVEQQKTTTSTEPSHQELANTANQYVTLVGQAVDAAKKLRTIDLKTAHDISVKFNGLAKEGSQFGQSDLDQPLGHCFGMGGMANAWWHAQLSASKEPEKYADSVKGTAASYNEARKDCLAQISTLSNH